MSDIENYDEQDTSTSAGTSIKELGRCFDRSNREIQMSSEGRSGFAEGLLEKT